MKATDIYVFDGVSISRGILQFLSLLKREQVVKGTLQRSLCSMAGEEFRYKGKTSSCKGK